jgi:hypothetical protein
VRRLTARGYQQALLVDIINTTYQRLAAPPPRQESPDTDPNPEVCFFHTYFHPDNPKSYEIQQLFQEEMYSPKKMYKKLPDLLNHRKAKLRVNKLIVAYHRTPNIGNLLSPRVMKSEDGPRVSSYIG